MLQASGLWFACTSEMVAGWQERLFSDLLERGRLKEDEAGLLTLTTVGEGQLDSWFSTFGPVPRQQPPAP